MYNKIQNGCEYWWKYSYWIYAKEKPENSFTFLGRKWRMHSSALNVLKVIIKSNNLPPKKKHVKRNIKLIRINIYISLKKYKRHKAYFIYFKKKILFYAKNNTYESSFITFSSINSNFTVDVRRKHSYSRNNHSITSW